MAKATAVDIRPGLNKGTVYAQTKSGYIYRLNYRFTSRKARDEFINRVWEAEGRIDTKAWFKLPEAHKVSA